MSGRTAFLALAFTFRDYAKANIPMLPHTHGVPYTKLNIGFILFFLLALARFPILFGCLGCCI